MCKNKQTNSISQTDSNDRWLFIAVTRKWKQNVYLCTRMHILITINWNYRLNWMEPPIEMVIKSELTIWCTLTYLRYKPSLHFNWCWLRHRSVIAMIVVVLFSKFAATYILSNINRNTSNNFDFIELSHHIIYYNLINTYFRGQSLCIIWNMKNEKKHLKSSFIP